MPQHCLVDSKMTNVEQIKNPSGFFDPSVDLNVDGVDLNQLRRNLARSLEERIERNRQAAIKILECKRAFESSRVRNSDQGV